MMTLLQLLLSLALSCYFLCQGSSGFTIHVPSMLVDRRSGATAKGLFRQSHHNSLICCWAKKKGKLSMAEKRKRRAQKLTRQPSTAHLPKANLNFASPPEEKESSNKDDKKIYAKDAREAATKAKDLLKAQRESVDMLTFVKERVEAKLADESIAKDLEGKGFCYIDNFLDDDNIVQQIANEGIALLDKEGQMQADLSNGLLGTGEYVCSLQGGQDQYTVSPRSIEWVVSVTKHFGDTVKLTDQDLDTQRCISQMRTFDRRALEAISSEVLQVAGSGSPESDAKEDTSESSSTSTDGLASSRPFTRMASQEDASTDLRRVSLCYYAVPRGWDEADGGGGLTFATVIKPDGGYNEEADRVTIAAVRDRLVVWMSGVPFRSEPWLGGSKRISDGVDMTDEAKALPPRASCIELQLLASQQ